MNKGNAYVKRRCKSSANRSRHRLNRPTQNRIISHCTGIVRLLSSGLVVGGGCPRRPRLEYLRFCLACRVGEPERAVCTCSVTVFETRIVFLGLQRGKSQTLVRFYFLRGVFRWFFSCKNVFRSKR